MIRAYVRCDIRLDSPWAVRGWGSADPSTTEDRSRQEQLRRLPTSNGLPEETSPELPASTLAGSLRAHVAASSGTDLDVLTMGPRPPEKKDRDQLSASPWWLLAVRLPHTATVESTTKTAIDRFRGAPRSDPLRSEERVGPDTQNICLYLMWEDTLSPGDMTSHKAMLTALKTWRPTFGAGVSTGLGRATVTDVVTRTFDTAKSEDLAELLLTDKTGPDRLDSLLLKKETHQKPAERDAEADLVLTARLELQDGVRLAAEDRSARTTVDGSTWKGLLRARVEYIGRSLGITPSPCEKQDGCGECEVCRVFGSTKARGLLSFDITAVDRDHSRTQPRTRVAVDRFTGGARPNSLWTVTEERGIQLRIVVRALREASLGWVGQALLHALRDLDDGLIGIGLSQSVGYGTVHVEDIRLGSAAQSCLGITPGPFRLTALEPVTP